MSADKKRVYMFIKRALDMFFSFLLLVFLCLPMLIIALAIRLDSDGSILFRQNRVGKDGRVFVCYKFRTMHKNTPSYRPSSSFTDAHRYVTRVGAFLRRTSLDELPQLFNVLKGDMSIVGPRPLIIQEREVHKSRMENGVYSLRPGITGLAQVSGRDRVSDAEKVRLDTLYAHTVGLVRDARIIGMTIGRVLRGDGIMSEAKNNKNTIDK
jgi:O-antigen biosynthesis protein WbqP